MGITAVYKRETDYGAETESFLRDLGRKIGEEEIRVLDPETIDGEIFTRAYDITNYPAIVATNHDGKVLQSWTGLPLPRIDDVSYYANA